MMLLLLLLLEDSLDPLSLVSVEGQLFGQGSLHWYDLSRYKWYLRLLSLLEHSSLHHFSSGSAVSLALLAAFNQTDEAHNE